MKKFNSQEVNDILNCVADGICVTDGDGNIVLLNKTSVELSCFSEMEMVGRNVRDLIAEGYWKEEEVVSLKCIRSKKTENQIQKGTGEDHEITVTAVPVMEGEDVKFVVVTERDVSDINRTEKELRNNKKLVEKYRNELNHYKQKEKRYELNIIFNSKEMDKVITLAGRVAQKDITVLIQGESGTGKEVVANYIHKVSDRSDAPFIRVNCDAIPETLFESELFGYEKGAFSGASEKGKEGLFELANGGILFLDEIGNMPLSLQGKLLRVLQNKEIMHVGGKETIPIDVRIIAATNVNLKKSVENGIFRLDLYYRLNVVPIMIPPLRTRREDILPLAKHFIEIYSEKYNSDLKIDKEGWEALYRYSWPGNIRELENIIRRLIIISDDRASISSEEVVAQLDDFVPGVSGNILESGTLHECMEAYEKNIIMNQMSYYKDSKELADALGIDKSTLNRKIKKYGIREEL